jgi:hypothetical protein
MQTTQQHELDLEHAKEVKCFNPSQPKLKVSSLTKMGETPSVMPKFSRPQEQLGLHVHTFQSAVSQLHMSAPPTVAQVLES